METNYRGKILIHAGLTLEKDMKDRFEEYNLDYNLGYIIGEAEIVDCILIDNNLYHVGASLKDLGNKCFAISKIEDKDYLDRILLSVD